MRVLRGFFGGRPRGRLKASTLPLKNRRPPHTPYGSRRASAPSKHASCTGHSAHSALARPMSSSCSEKNSAVRAPVPSLHRAASRSTSRSSHRSASIALPFLVECERPPGFPAASGHFLGGISSYPKGLPPVPIGHPISWSKPHCERVRGAIWGVHTGVTARCSPEGLP